MDKDYICIFTAKLDTLFLLLVALSVLAIAGWIYIALMWLGVL